MSQSYTHGDLFTYSRPTEQQCKAHDDNIRRWYWVANLPSNRGQCENFAITEPLTKVYRNGIPPDCPFSIRPMNHERSLFLIREKDKYGEYPNIYAKIVPSANYQPKGIDTRAVSLIVLCDTGCGTNVEPRNLHSHVEASTNWNIGSFLEATINPQYYLPYLVITSHCHYDHILGIKNLDLARSTILSSAYNKSFITPRSKLAENSLCKDLGITPPEYEVGIWAADLQEVVVTPSHSSQSIYTGITILQTPGHTPDSLAWYDSTLSPPQIFVGDSLYERQSDDTRNAKWGREPPMPTIFNVNSNLTDWSRSMKKMINFVQERNRELQVTDSEPEPDSWVLISQAPGRETPTPRVMLSAAHVTVSVDAEDCLLVMMEFMQRILRNEVPHCRVEDEKDHEVWLWDDVLDAGCASGSQTLQEKAEFGRFSVKAPLFVIEKERASIKKRSSKYDDGEIN